MHTLALSNLVLVVIPCSSPPLKSSDMIVSKLILEILDGAELSKRIVRVRDLPRSDDNSMRLGSLLDLIDLSDRLDNTEVSGDSAEFFVHLVER